MTADRRSPAELDAADSLEVVTRWAALCGWDRPEAEQLAVIFGGETVPPPPDLRRAAEIVDPRET